MKDIIVLVACSSAAIPVLLFHPQPGIAGCWTGPARAVVSDTRTGKVLQVTNGKASICGNGYGAYNSFKNQTLSITATICTNDCGKATRKNKWKITINEAATSGEVMAAPRGICVVKVSAFTKYCWRAL